MHTSQLFTVYVCGTVYLTTVSLGVLKCTQVSFLLSMCVAQFINDVILSN